MRQRHHEKHPHLTEVRRQAEEGHIGPGHSRNLQARTMRDRSGCGPSDLVPLDHVPLCLVVRLGLDHQMHDLE
jgi:hypothetical protein